MCPRNPVLGATAVSELYEDPNETYSELVYARKSKFLLNFIDVVGDGICCNNGADGSYEVSVNNAVQFRGGQSGSFTSEAEVFGDCVDSVTAKPTNIVRYYLLSITLSVFLTVLFFPTSSLRAQPAM